MSIARETPSAERRLRIAYVYRHFNRSGSLPTVFLTRAEFLSWEEDVTAIVSAASRVATNAPLHFETVEPVVVGTGRLRYAAECASFAFRATRLLKRLRTQFDVIHVDGFSAAVADLVTVHAVRRAEIDHYFEHVEPTARLRRRLTPLLRPQTGTVIGIENRLYRPPFPLCLPMSRRIAEDLQRHFGVPDDLIEVIPYGLDLQAFRFNPEARLRERASMGTPPDRLAVLFVGDDFERKGLDQAIGALARTSQHVELWVAGGGEQERHVALASSLGVTDRMRFLGRVPNDRLAQIYSAADVFVLPSRQDAWGHPVIEAMASGRPVIVSPFTGSEEAVESGATGFVLEAGDGTEQIAALLNGPLAKPEARQAMGTRAAESVADFDRGVVFPRLRAAHHRAARLRNDRLAGG
jgi:glycosyltransferase involved in cell wall biosynthesis